MIHAEPAPDGTSTAPPEPGRDQEHPSESEPGGIAALGAGAIDMALGARQLYSVLVRTLYYCFRGRREKGALLLKRLELLLQLLDTENAADSLTKCGRERVRSDEVLVCSLRVLGKDTDLSIARNDWVRQGTVKPSICIIV